MRLQR